MLGFSFSLSLWRAVAGCFRQCQIRHEIGGCFVLFSLCILCTYIQIQVLERIHFLTSSTLHDFQAATKTTPSFHVLNWATSRTLPPPPPWPPYLPFSIFHIRCSSRRFSNPLSIASSLLSVNFYFKSLGDIFSEYREQARLVEKVASTDVAPSIKASDHGLHLIVLLQSRGRTPTPAEPTLKQLACGGKPEQKTASFLLPSRSKTIVRSRRRCDIYEGWCGSRANM